MNNIKSLIAAIRSNGRSNTTLTRKGIELSFVYLADGRDLSTDKADMKACKEAYESANNGLRWASSPLYKSIKTVCKRVAAGDFKLAAAETAEQAAGRYIAEMAAAGASLQNCLTFAEMDEKAATKESAAAESAAESVFATLAAALAAAETAEQAAADMLAEDEETAAALAAALAKAIKAAVKAKAAA